MRILAFAGMAPKLTARALKDEMAEYAENIDVYSTGFRPIKSLGQSEVLVDVYGEVINGEVASIYKVSDVYIGFPTYTTIAYDVSERLGQHTFLFVKDGVLYRQTPARINAKQPPIMVGIRKPLDEHKPTATVEAGAGCEVENIQLECFPEDNASCEGYVPNPPEMTAYKYTYVNQCGEESVDSYPTNFVDVANGDAVALRANDEPPENAVIRRWYRAVVTEKQSVEWLNVGEHPVSEDVFYDSFCTDNLGEPIPSDKHHMYPDCIAGVVNIGNNRVALWGGNKLYLSTNGLPHAYPPNNVIELRFPIISTFAVTAQIEAQYHYVILVITEGLHYRISVEDDGQVGISEIQNRLPAISAQLACQNEMAVYYISPMGLVQFSIEGLKLLTSELFTEREWAEYVDELSRPVFADNSLYVFNRERDNFKLTLDQDSRRPPTLVMLSHRYDMGVSNNRGEMVVYRHGPTALFKHFGTGDENLTARWKSKEFVMDGLWRPVVLKVESPDFVHKSAIVRKLIKEYNKWKAFREDGDVHHFIEQYPEFAPYENELRQCYPSVEVVLYADGYEYYRGRVTSQRPKLLPRKHRALHWQVEVISNLAIDEIHIETSRESLARG